jgi:hypothetical protein
MEKAQLSKIPQKLRPNFFASCISTIYIDADLEYWTNVNQGSRQ